MVIILFIEVLEDAVFDCFCELCVSILLTEDFVVGEVQNWLQKRYADVTLP